MSVFAGVSMMIHTLAQWGLFAPALLRSLACLNKEGPCAAQPTHHQHSTKHGTGTEPIFRYLTLPLKAAHLVGNLKISGDRGKSKLSEL